jgi:hypothetical protein
MAVGRLHPPRPATEPLFGAWARGYALSNLAILAACTAPPGTVIVLEDDPSRRPNLHDAFGTLLEPALALVTRAHARVDCPPSRDGWTEARFCVPGDAPAPAERHLRLIGGELVASD